MCSHESPGKIPEFQSSLRCHRLTLPHSPSVFAVGADICNHWSHPFTCVCVSYKKTTRGSPRPPHRQCPAPPNPVLCLNLCSGSSGSQGRNRSGVGSAVTCWAISTELLGPRRSSFSGEGKARKVETSAGGGEDRTGAGSWGTGGTGGSVEVQIQTPYPEHMPLMQASQGSESRIPQSSPRVGCPQMLALVGSLCKSLWGRGKPPPSDSKSLVQPSGSSP